MVRSLQLLQTERQELSQKVVSLAGVLWSQYENYCLLLGESAQKQFIIAAYQICTQVYPESFLKLTFNQRDKLQTQLRELGLDIAKRLQQALQAAKVMPPGTGEVGETVAPLPFTTPEQVLSWCQQREQDIHSILENISQTANRLLQQVQIIPRSLPTPLLEIALKGGKEPSPPGQSPNILDILLEGREGQEDDDSSLKGVVDATKITAIHLRLVEIEFNDAQLTLLHKKIYQSLEKLGHIHQRYQRNQRETAIANAESAWRSSWREEI